MLKSLLFVCVFGLTACTKDPKPASDAVKALIDNCNVPVGMEVRVSDHGTEFSVRCDSMKTLVKMTP